MLALVLAHPRFHPSFLPRPTFPVAVAVAVAAPVAVAVAVVT